MSDRPLTVRDLHRLLACARAYNLRHVMHSRIDGVLGAVLAELEAMMQTERHTFVIEEAAPHHSRLTVPLHPITAVVSVVNGKGETLPPSHYLVDTGLGLIRYAGNRDFSEYPYTVTVER